MATSGVTTYWPDIQILVEEAYERAGYDLHTMTAGHTVTARRSLQFIFSDWANRGVKLWTLEEAVEPLIAGQDSFSLSASVLDVLEVNRRRGDVDTPLIRVSRTELFEMPGKNTEGVPDRFSVDRTNPNDRRLRWWPKANTADDSLAYWRVRRLYDPVAATEQADVPYEAWDALASDLAYRLYQKRPADQMSEVKMATLGAAASLSFDRVSAGMRERASTFIVPMWGYW